MKKIVIGKANKNIIIAQLIILIKHTNNMDSYLKHKSNRSEHQGKVCRLELLCCTIYHTCQHVILAI